ncbi:hypothetical protein [Streptomyces boluensis]|uniref:Uncharacterized protein n=1 Tax=Streptomyces boluensis TaxID=1775135 RepID=A0A964XJJ4_9ACTN|nr:hypothetical protein [Streptomyces boluensis]NBE51369.1 hypothetical protein [Streptomyces boluensis]
MSKQRKRKATWAVAGSAAVLAVTGAGIAVHEELSEDTVCCGIPLPRGNAPSGPDGEIDIASQSVKTDVLVDEDFSLHVRPGGDADDWEPAETGEEYGVLRAKGEKTVRGTRYFKFRALRTGKARIVLREVDGDRTMTYPIEVKKTLRSSSTTRDPEEGFSDPYAPDESIRLDGDFGGKVTVRAGHEFAVANRYTNQPGYGWRFLGQWDDHDLALTSDQSYVAGDPSAVRQDWYTFKAYEKGSTTIKLFGCYRCGDDMKPKSAESKKFSVTKTLTVIVR